MKNNFSTLKGWPPGFYVLKNVNYVLVIISRSTVHSLFSMLMKNTVSYWVLVGNVPVTFNHMLHQRVPVI